jgi:hypothetical protein
MEGDLLGIRHVVWKMCMDRREYVVRMWTAWN